LKFAVLLGEFCSREKLKLNYIIISSQLIGGGTAGGTGRDSGNQDFSLADPSGMLPLQNQGELQARHHVQDGMTQPLQGGKRDPQNMALTGMGFPKREVPLAPTQPLPYQYVPTPEKFQGLDGGAGPGVGLGILGKGQAGLGPKMQVPLEESPAGKTLVELGLHAPRPQMVAGGGSTKPEEEMKSHVTVGETLFAKRNAQPGSKFGKNLVLAKLREKGVLEKIRKEGEIRAKIKRMREKVATDKPYFALKSLKHNSPLKPLFGLDWHYGFLTNLPYSLSKFLWSVDWNASERSHRRLQLRVGRERKKLEESGLFRKTMYSSLPGRAIASLYEGDIISDDMVNIARITREREERHRAELSAIETATYPEDHLILLNFERHSTDCADMGLRHNKNYFCKVRDFSSAYCIADAYDRSWDLSKLYCSHCNRILARTGHREHFVFCRSCRDHYENPQSSNSTALSCEPVPAQDRVPYVLCDNCNRVFKLTLVALRLRETGVPINEQDYGALGNDDEQGEIFNM